jgi:alkanesulfonate monooxygenase SsuD/methylene tetrahydromethanopterin reductase-like flavin-dependent oxidoreductase (luciferase family)
VALAAIACATDRLRLGPMVTPLSRRRIHKLAQETVTVDHLSRGRLTLGVGLGSSTTGELEPFGEVVDPRTRARLLDDGLEQLSAFWGGEFEPRPLQRPRIPVWVAGRWPSRRPVRRAAKWDGMFPIELPGPEALEVLADEVRSLGDRRNGHFEFVVRIPPGDDVVAWELTGATWVLTGFGAPPREAEVRDVIENGPS